MIDSTSTCTLMAQDYVSVCRIICIPSDSQTLAFTSTHLLKFETRFRLNPVVPISREQQNPDKLVFVNIVVKCRKTEHIFMSICGCVAHVTARGNIAFMPRLAFTYSLGVSEGNQRSFCVVLFRIYQFHLIMKCSLCCHGNSVQRF